MLLHTQELAKQKAPCIQHYLYSRRVSALKRGYTELSQMNASGNKGVCLKDPHKARQAVSERRLCVKQTGRGLRSYSGFQQC